MPSNQFNREITAKGTARSSIAAARSLHGLDVPPCPYDRHRPTDWRLADSTLVVCGICHPPPAGLNNIVNVNPA